MLIGKMIFEIDDVCMEGFLKINRGGAGWFYRLMVVARRKLKTPNNVSEPISS